MSGCDETRLLLGPFDDGELEPHEMEDVAFHIVSCTECKSALDDYRALGMALRDAMPQPLLDGFAAAVIARIERIPVPLSVRIGRYFGSLSERIGAAAAMGAAAAVAAIITAVLVTPLADQAVLHNSPHRVIASATQAMPMEPLAPAPDTVAQKTNAADVIAQAENPGAQNSQAAISQLEADSPSVAVWNEPRTETTVIWVPNQP